MLQLVDRPVFRQYAAAIVSSMLVAGTGSAYSFLEPLTLRMTEGQEGVPVTKEQMSWLVALVEIGATFSSIASSYFSERYGRKLTNLINGPLLLLSWLLIIFTKSVWVLYIVRIIQGVAVGIAYTITPIYSAEIADPEIRGAISGVYQVAFYCGCTLTYITGPYLSYEWYALSSIPLPLIFTILFVFCPESPYWLLKRNRDVDARRALSWLKPNANIEKEFQDIKKVVAEDMERKNMNKISPWKTLFCNKYERKAILIVQIVCFTKYMTGLPTIMAYASETFSKSDHMLSPSEMSIIFGLLLAITAAVSAFLSDQVGRKTLLLVSCFGTFLSHVFTGTYYYLHENTSVDTSNLVWLMYIGIIMYCIFSNVGLGPLLQTLQAEMFATDTRELAGGITGTLASVLCFVIVKLYQPINDNIGVYFNFLLYSLSGLVGGILLAILMIETAGKVIGRMEDSKKSVDDTEKY